MGPRGGARQQSFAWVFGIGLLACQSGSPSAANREPARGVSASPATSGAKSSAGDAVRAAPFFLAGQPGLAKHLQTVMARYPKRDVLVYVGAPWCEPCRYFHQAIVDGVVDQQLADFVFVEFDVSEHRDELAAGGYGSKMVPLFVYSREDGRASSFRIEGSVKGAEAVARNLVPRLLQLKQRRRHSR